MAEKIVVKLESDDMYKMLFAMPETTAADLLNTFAEKCGISAKGLRLMDVSHAPERALKGTERPFNRPEITYYRVDGVGGGAEEAFPGLRAHVVSTSSSTLVNDAAREARMEQAGMVVKPVRKQMGQIKKADAKGAKASDVKLDLSMFGGGGDDLGLEAYTCEDLEFGAQGELNADDVSHASSLLNQMDGSSRAVEVEQFNTELGSQLEGPRSQALGFEFMSLMDPSMQVVDSFAMKLDFTEIAMAGIARCDSCGDIISGKGVAVFGKLYHANHITCSVCGLDFTGGRQALEGREDNKVYCFDDYHETFSKKCHHCEKPIVKGPREALGYYWHEEHFTCKTCKRAIFTDFHGEYKEWGGDVYCEYDYYGARGLICPVCEEPILPDHDKVDSGGHRFHEEHFVCNYCRDPIPPTSLYRMPAKRPNTVYCGRCGDRVMSVS